MNWLLKKLEAKGRKHIIKDREEIHEYLTRYYLYYPDSNQRVELGLPEKVKFNAFLHQFLRSDDPVFHNHPWKWYATLILKGGYYEHTPWGTFWREPGHFRIVKGNQFKHLHAPSPNFHRLIRSGLKNPLLHSDLHWVEIPKSGKTWTLFLRGEDHGKDWGFVPDVTTGKWIQHEEYLANQRKKHLEKDEYTGFEL